MDTSKFYSLVKEVREKKEEYLKSHLKLLRELSKLWREADNQSWTEYVCKDYNKAILYLRSLPPIDMGETQAKKIINHYLKRIGRIDLIKGG